MMAEPLGDDYGCGGSSFSSGIDAWVFLFPWMLHVDTGHLWCTLVLFWWGGEFWWGPCLSLLQVVGCSASGALW